MDLFECAFLLFFHTHSNWICDSEKLRICTAPPPLHYTTRWFLRFHSPTYTFVRPSARPSSRSCICTNEIRKDKLCAETWLCIRVYRNGLVGRRTKNHVVSSCRLSSSSSSSHLKVNEWNRMSEMNIQCIAHIHRKSTRPYTHIHSQWWLRTDTNGRSSHKWTQDNGHYSRKWWQ